MSTKVTSGTTRLVAGATGSPQQYEHVNGSFQTLFRCYLLASQKFLSLFQQKMVIFVHGPNFSEVAFFSFQKLGYDL